MKRTNLVFVTGVAALAGIALVRCSASVEKTTAYRGRLKVEHKVDVAKVRTPNLEIQLVTAGENMGAFEAEIKKTLPTFVPASTTFKKVVIGGGNSRGTATASRGPVLKMTLQSYKEPGFMNQYNGELTATLEFWNDGKMMGKAVTIGTTKHDETTMGVGNVSWKTSGKEPTPVWTASQRVVGFTGDFLKGSDSRVEGAMF